MRSGHTPVTRSSAHSFTQSINSSPQVKIMKILIVSNGIRLPSLSRVARNLQWDVTEVCDETEAEILMQHIDFQLAFGIIDQISSTRFSKFKAIGLTKNDCPKIAVLEKDTPEERALAWRCNALACLNTNASPEEIETAALSLLRFKSSIASDILSCGSLELNLTSNEVRSLNGEIMLTKKQFQLLELLLINKGKAVRREQMMNHLYGFNSFPEQKILDVMICKMRTKLQNAGANDVSLQTVRGVGYRLNTLSTSAKSEGVKLQVTV